MKCFLYCRKSLEDKARQVQSIEDQKKIMKEIAQTRNLEITNVFTDEKSAGIPHLRPAFQEMMKQIQKGEVQAILTWKIDRLSRNPIENGQLSWMLQQGIIQEIITSDRNYLPQDNVLLFMVEGAMANQYLRDLSTNVKRGMNSRVKKGVFPGHAPLGYLNAGIQKGNKKIVADPMNFPFLQELWNLLKTKKYQLADLYRIMQVQYPIYKKGKVLAFSSFYRIFHNSFYCGILKWGGEFHLGTHQIMLTQSEFDSIQHHLGKKEKTREKNLEFDFKGILKCGHCDACITAERKTKFIISENTNKTFDYYRCTHRKRDIECHQKPLSQKQIETQLSSELEKVSLPDCVFEFGIAQLKKTNTVQSNTQSQGIVNLEKEIQNLENRIIKIEENLALESNVEIREILRKKYAESKIQVQKCREDIQTLKCQTETRNQSIIDSLKIIQNGKQLIQEGTKEQKKRIFYGLGSNWKINDRKLVYEPHFVIEAVSKTKKVFSPENRMFEPHQKHITLSEKMSVSQVGFVWSTLWELIRNSKDF